MTDHKDPLLVVVDPPSTAYTFAWGVGVGVVAVSIVGAVLALVWGG